MTGPVEAAIGSTVLRRDVTRGRVSTLQPLRVVEETGGRLAGVLWPGVACRGPATWVETTTTGSEVARARLITELGLGTWELVEFAWQQTVRLSFHEGDTHASPMAFFDASGRFLGWYVNIEVPAHREGARVDTCDLGLDLVVRDDGSWVWKDVDEYQRMVDLGAISARRRDAVEAERAAIVERVEERRDVFGEGWETWTVPTWPDPVIDDVLADAPIPAHLRNAM